MEKGQSYIYIVFQASEICVVKHHNFKEVVLAKNVGTTTWCCRTDKKARKRALQEFPWVVQQTDHIPFLEGDQWDIFAHRTF